MWLVAALLVDVLLGSMMLGFGGGVAVAGRGTESDDRVGVGDSLSRRSSSSLALLTGTSGVVASSLSSSFAVSMAMVLFNFLFFFSRMSTFFCHISSPP